MAITKNDYLKIVTDPETGEKKLFGKCGYQTMHKGTDKYTLANMAAIERAMLAGNLKDINGEVATDGAVICTFSVIRTVKSADSIEQVDELVGVDGTVAAVPAAPAPVAGAVANPFGS